MPFVNQEGLQVLKTAPKVPSQDHLINASSLDSDQDFKFCKIILSIFTFFCSEDIRNQNKIFTWNCEMQEKCIAKGRGLRNELRKVQFNKAVAEADNLFLQQEKRLKGNNLGAKRKSRGGQTGASTPRKSPRIHLTKRINGEQLVTHGKSLTDSAGSEMNHSSTSLQNNCFQGNHTPRKSAIARADKNGEATKSGCIAKNNKSVDSSLEDSLKTSSKERRKSCVSEPNTLMSAEKQASQRKSPQYNSKQCSPREFCQNRSKVLTLSEERANLKKSSQDESLSTSLTLMMEKSSPRNSSSQDGSRALSSRRKSVQSDESKTLLSKEKLGRCRKASQVRSNTLTLTEKQDRVGKGLSTGHGQGVTTQKKRKLVRDTEPKHKRNLSKKGKSFDQKGLEHGTGDPRKGHGGNNLPSTGNTLLKNGHKDVIENNKELEICSDMQTADEKSTASVGAACSASSDSSSSDDELMTEAFSPSQESNQFAVNDIVWAKYFSDPYWPAVIKRLVTSKRKCDSKILVQFLGWNGTLFKIQPKKLVHFACDQTQKEEFLGVEDKLKSKGLQDNFEQALKEAEDLLNRKGLGKNLDDEVDEDDEDVFEEEDDVEDNGEIEKESKGNVQEILSPLEYRKSARTKKQVSQYGNILSYIRQAKTFLKQILNGTKISERHSTFMSGRVSEKDNLKHRAGFGPIADENLKEEIMDLLVQFYKEFKGTQDITYVSEVWLPEAIIWSIQQIQHVGRQKAEEMYLEGSKMAVTKEEVQQLTAKFKKKKKLSLEDATERLQKAERVIARYSATES